MTSKNALDLHHSIEDEEQDYAAASRGTGRRHWLNGFAIMTAKTIRQRYAGTDRKTPGPARWAALIEAATEAAQQGLGLNSVLYFKRNKIDDDIR